MQVKILIPLIPAETVRRPECVLSLAESPSARPSRRKLWLAAAMCFVALRAVPTLTYPLGRDQGTYLFIGRSLLQGKLLYRDLWDNKPPGIFYVYAVIGKIFGKAMWSAAVVDILLLFLVSYCIFRFAERYVGSAGAAIAVAVDASWHVQRGYILAAQPEDFQLPLVFLAYFLVAHGARDRAWAWRGFAAGLALGGACWLKYNAIGFLPLLLLLPYLNRDHLSARPRRLSLTVPWREWVRRSSAVIAGLGFAIAAVLAYFWLKGAWPAMKEVQFGVLLTYGKMGVTSRSCYLTSMAVRTGLYLGRWTEVAVLVALCLAWWRRDLSRYLPLALAAGSAFFATALQLRLHDYYFETCFPFFAMTWGYLGVSLYEGARHATRACTRRRWQLARVLVWVLFANIVFWPLPEEFDRVRMSYEDFREWRRDRMQFYTHHPWQIPFEHLKGQMDVVAYLKQNSTPQDSVFLWGAHELIYYLSDRRPPTRFVSDMGLLSRWSPWQWRAEAVRDLERTPPKFIIVARGDALPSITYVAVDSEQYLPEYPQLDRLIRGRYKLAVDFDTFVVYGRVEPWPKPVAPGSRVSSAVRDSASAR